MGEGNDASMVYMHPLREHRLKILLPNLLVTFPKGWPDWPPTVRVQRGESSTARCASTGDEWATPPIQCAIEEGNVLEGTRAISFGTLASGR